MIETVTSALYFFIPAYAANTFACILGKGRPVDLGRNFTDGRRILGNGVTIRGSLSGIVCGMIAGVILQMYFPLVLMNFSLIFLLATGAMVGDAAGSFTKRRLGREQGSPAPVLDQLNFVVGGLLFASVLGPVQWQWILVIVTLTPFGHLLVNKTGYLLKMKDVPW
jgi:CDP-2,3-bis-(O-geranylgeranyl)-sn-glycerol synthase